MGGGALLGLGGGAATLVALRRLPVEAALAPILALAAALALFGGAQFVGASGFLGDLSGWGSSSARRPPRSRESLERSSTASAWLAQIVLFLMLGLLVTPHQLLPFVRPALVHRRRADRAGAAGGGVRLPAAVRLQPRETAFASWVGLRGAVPIYPEPHPRARPICRATRDCSPPLRRSSSPRCWCRAGRSHPRRGCWASARRPRTRLSSDEPLPRQAFGAKAMHQPFGLIVPSTILQALGGRKLTQPLHF